SELVAPLDLARDCNSCLALPRPDLAQTFLDLGHQDLNFGPVGTTSLDHPTEVVLGRWHQRLGARTGLSIRHERLCLVRDCHDGHHRYHAALCASDGASTAR